MCINNCMLVCICFLIYIVLVSIVLNKYSSFKILFVLNVFWCNSLIIYNYVKFMYYLVYLLLYSM